MNRDLGQEGICCTRGSIGRILASTTISIVIIDPYFSVEWLHFNYAQLGYTLQGPDPIGMQFTHIRSHRLRADISEAEGTWKEKMH